MFDFDSADSADFPFEDDFDAGGPHADFDPDMLGALDGAVADAFAARKARLTEVLVGGETGVVFESLALFAEPLFTLYELNPADAFRLREAPDEVGDDIVALLETARVLWAFFSMPPPERAHKRQTLAAQLVGEDPSDDDWLSLDGLLDAAEIHWKALLPDEIDAAQSTPSPTLDFDALLEHPAFRVGAEADSPAHAGFGPAALSEVEARALFAQPLLDDPDAMASGDAFEDALARADALWSLAQTAGPDAEPHVQAFAQAHATSPAHAARLEDEAHRMIARYRDLFPERATTPA
jgi:hypothetical protein